MLTPHIKDINNSLQAATVAAQCQQCAKDLAGSLYVWRKPFPGKATVKSWDTASLTFQGMDLDLFREYLIRSFVLTTADSKEWLFDRAVAAAIWAACVAQDSPLPLASWEAEITLKRTAARK